MKHSLSHGALARFVEAECERAGRAGFDQPKPQLHAGVFALGWGGAGVQGIGVQGLGYRVEG